MNRTNTLLNGAWLLALGVLALCLPGAAKAQGDYTPELSRDWSVRVGVYVFNSKTTSDQGSRVAFSGLVERRVYHGDTFDVGVGVGYNGFDAIYSVPITVTGVLHRGNVRLGAGAGYSFNKRPFGNSSQGTVFDLLLGYQLTHGKNALSADARYYFVAGASNELDGLSLTLGYQF